MPKPDIRPSLPLDRTWPKVNDPKIDDSGDLGKGKRGHKPRPDSCWSMIQLVHPKVAQPKPSALQPQVCIC